MNLIDHLCSVARLSPLKRDLHGMLSVCMCSLKLDPMLSLLRVLPGMFSVYIAHLNLIWMDVIVQCYQF